MIEATGLTKVYGDKTAVDGVSFTVQAGRVTGFLGPNGAGKSTTMRMIMGLDRPTSGSVTVNGVPFAQHAAPLREVGSLLDAKAVHTGRSAGLVSLEVPDEVTPDESDEILRALREDDSIEYANRPPRRSVK